MQMPQMKAKHTESRGLVVTITADWLAMDGGCPQLIRKFREAFPNGLFNDAGSIAAMLDIGFNPRWIAKRFLAPDALAEYDRIVWRPTRLHEMRVKNALAERQRVFKNTIRLYYKPMDSSNTAYAKAMARAAYRYRQSVQSAKREYHSSIVSAIWTAGLLMIAA